MATVTASYWCARYTPKAGDVIVDVGAGDGADLPVYAELVGRTGIVLAIEPHPELYRQMETTARDLLAIRCVEAACVERPGQLVWMDSGQPWEARTTRGEPSETHTVFVPAFTLDDIVFAHGLTRIDLLKMNIEGAEVAALHGASTTLAMTHHAVIGAHDFRAAWGEGEHFRTRAAVIDLLRAAGFEAAVSQPWDHVHAWRSDHAR